ncbi:MAG TPA: hypothetical protein VJ761_16470 [Ktedonobacteraceae bacterium]|nr:hypothetical protein [Ktedonobacteraceae bacterium]
MANWLEDLTKTIADDKLTRRQAVRRIVGVVAGATLATWLPEQALAQNIPWKKQCTMGGNCDYTFFNCNNPNPNCICFTGAPGAPAAFCGCNTYCSQLSTCKIQSHCPRGTICSIENGCDNCGTTTSPAVCIPACKGKHKNCTLGSGHGMTAAGRVV